MGGFELQRLPKSACGRFWRANTLMIAQSYCQRFAELLCCLCAVRCFLILPSFPSLAQEAHWHLVTCLPDFEGIDLFFSMSMVSELCSVQMAAKALVIALDIA